MANVRVGDVYEDLDSREKKKARTVKVQGFSEDGQFAYCLSSAKRESRIHTIRLTDEKLFKLAKKGR